MPDGSNLGTPYGSHFDAADEMSRRALIRFMNANNRLHRARARLARMEMEVKRRRRAMERAMDALMSPLPL